MARTIHFNGTNRFLGMHPAGPGVEEPWTAYVIEQGDGVRPWLPVLPYKGLPVGPYVKSVNDYIVIPKGKIVSIAEQIDLAPDVTDQYNPGIWDPEGALGPGAPDADSTTTGIQPPLEPARTSLPITPEPDTTPGIDVFTPTHVDEVWDDEYYTPQYEREMAGYIVFANGGIPVNLSFSDIDVKLGTPFFNGTDWVTVTDPSSQTLTIPVNKPIGIVYQDVYRDIRGRYLNWDNQPPVGILTDYYIAVPFIDYQRFVDYANANWGEVDTTTWHLPSAGTACTPDNPIYHLSRLWAFAWSSTTDITERRTGALVAPDVHGNYRILTTTEADSTNPEQFVGRVLFIDYRYPKNMNDVVDTFPGSGAGAGTETGGLPWHLFHFIQDLLLLAGVAPEHRKINQIVSYVYEHKFFGMAYINLHVS